MTHAQDLLFMWSPAAAVSLGRVKIEDDTLRDGLQGAFVRRPSLEEKKELLALSAAVGTQAAMLGFPASSASEFEHCRTLVAFLDERELALVPRFLARAMIADVEPIAALQEGARRPVWADFFVGCSPLRRTIEGWALSSQLENIRRTGEFLFRSGVPFGVSLEDASRTPPEDLRLYIDAALTCGARVLTICDTVGDATPSGAAQLIRFVKQAIAGRDGAVEIWWHGHNDRGLALANALAAAEAGADALSGSFLGIGERTGNTPLEQVVMFLAQSGHPGYRIEALVPYCSRLAEITDSPIPLHAPLVGLQAFATCTGTHAAAILKARKLGTDFEDYVFSSVPASRLGRSQELPLGPTSGMATARHALAQLLVEVTEENARQLLGHAKRAERPLTPDEIRRFYSASAVMGQDRE